MWMQSFGVFSYIGDLELKKIYTWLKDGKYYLMLVAYNKKSSIPKSGTGWYEFFNSYVFFLAPSTIIKGTEAETPA